MATWYIGIDETGRFNPHSSVQQPSFVCAVVTQQSANSIKNLLQVVFKDANGREAASDTELYGSFHGGATADKTYLNAALKSLLAKENGTVLHIIKSKGQPAVLSNPQQWWTAATLGVIKKFFDSNIAQKDDTIKIRIDYRKSTVLGFVEEFTITDDSEPLPENAVKNTLENIDAYHKYLEALAGAIQQKLTQQYPHKIEVTFTSASGSPLVTLADIACNLVKTPFRDIIKKEFGEQSEEYKKVTPIKAAPLNMSFGNDVEDCIASGDLIHACEALLSLHFGGIKNQLPFIQRIFEKASKRELPQIWSLIFTAIKNAFDNRGFDGKSVEYAIALANELVQYSDNIPNDGLKKSYLQTVSEIIAHSGSTSLDVFEKMEQSFKQADSSFKTTIDRWNYYVYYKAMKAQALFNGYQFDKLDFEDLKKTQEALDHVQFPFKNDEGLPKDENFAMIYGTLGQAAAFRDELDEAIPLLEIDYSRSPDSSKDKPASYLTIVHHKKRSLQKAIEWFEKQCGMTLDEFKANLTPSTNQWFTVNYFRIVALGADLGVPELTIPKSSEWKNSGSYPWPLLQKWAAFIFYKENTESSIFDAKNLLKCSKKLLCDDDGFTIPTLAFPVIAMQIVIAKEQNNEKELEAFVRDYQTLLEKCMQTSPSFAAYVNAHECFKKACSGELSLWEAATLLPFNYS